jgi:hypothetical protein
MPDIRQSRIGPGVEDESLPTILGYGHGDVVHGMEGERTKGRGPWETAREGERLYGRGTADNKAQHSINMAALRAVLAERGGKLGFQREVHRRDGRGDRLEGPQGTGARARMISRRRVHRLRRSACKAGASDAGSRLPGDGLLRSGGRSTERRASLRQLGRAHCQSRHHSRPCACLDCGACPNHHETTGRPPPPLEHGH